MVEDEVEAVLISKSLSLSAIIRDDVLRIKTEISIIK